jgi:hypothetical protein
MSKSQTQWTAYSKQVAVNMTIPFGNNHTYLCSHGGVDTNPDKLSPNLETCQESMAMASTHNYSETMNKPSTENTHNKKSILSMQDLVILHANNIFPQNSQADSKAYKHLHGIAMHIHSIRKPPKQNAHNMGLYDLYEEEFNLFAMEYNTTNDGPDNELDHYVITLQRSNEDYDPAIKCMFLNNLDPIFYAMQMQNPDVLAHAKMKIQVDGNIFINAQRPEIEGLMDINTFEFIHKTKLPAKTRYLDLIWT